MQICNQCHKEVADGMYECPYCGSRALSGLMGGVKTTSVAKDENVTESDDETFADTETEGWRKQTLTGATFRSIMQMATQAKIKKKSISFCLFSPSAVPLLALWFSLQIRNHSQEQQKCAA